MWGMRFLTSHAPEHAERLWQILKQDFISVDANGGLKFRLIPLGWDTRKPANFSRWPELNPLIVTLWAALEMGDDEIIAATRKTMNERYGEGTADSMTWSGRNTIRNMVNKGLPHSWATGPILANAAYPEVIVTRAVSDGVALSLVMHPGGESGRANLEFGRLVPGRTYRIAQTGESFTATSAGTQQHGVVLAGRTEIDVVPVQ
jgi:hypothetical protein